MRAAVVARCSGEFRQFRERHVHAERGRTDAQALDARAESAGRSASASSLRNSGFGPDIRRDRAGLDDAAVLQFDSRGASARRDDARHRRVGFERDPERRASVAMACVMAPMPPTACPHTPGLPFTSPNT